MLSALSGDPHGTPAWVRTLAEGDDAGLFADGGAVWTVHAGTGTFVAGIRALLMQALHPGPMAGVQDWSRYRDDPLGRLTGTVRWIICVTYGSRPQVERETARVTRLHERVTGTFVDGAGAERAYTAETADLVEWVHLAFADSFLACHRRWGAPIPGGQDAYVREWARAGRLMGMTAPPVTAAELDARLTGYRDRGELRGDERVREVVRFLRRPPFPGTMGLAYRFLFAAAVATIPHPYRRLLGVRRWPIPVITATRIILRRAQRSLDEGPRAQDFARERLRRLRRLS
ncbi:oxygenase MpaB family protein [Microbacterium hominis]|uniref:DUF2236 domain-containing protein n=1 Tax=Microbacterium hominis TaxID=162426 RepID=A0A7D4U6X8_9MICO|nr:DUF2236 domain-containing protein [Microbacterium hominis]